MNVRKRRLITATRDLAAWNRERRVQASNNTAKSNSIDRVESKQTSDKKRTDAMAGGTNPRPKGQAASRANRGQEFTLETAKLSKGTGPKK
jgi:hypothetical protein